MKARTQALLSLVVLAGALVSRAARAGSPAVTGFTGPVVRLADDGKTAAAPHPSSVALNVVNYSDCSTDLQYTFPIAVTGAAGNTLVAYVGTGDCTPYAARHGTPICWPAVDSTAINQTASTPTITVRMQDLAPTTAKAAASPSYTKSDLSVCTAQTAPAGSSLFLYFFYVDSNDNAIGVAQPYPLTVDTQAPFINGLFSVQDGDNSVVLTLPGTTDSSEIATWTALCDPPRGEETDADLYVAPDSSGTDANSSTDANDASSSTDANDANSSTDANDASSSTDATTDALASIDAQSGASDGGTDAEDDGEVSVDAGAPDSGDAGVEDAAADADAGDAAEAGGSGIPVNDAEIPPVGGCSSTVFGPFLQADAGATGQPQINLGGFTKYICGQALGGASTLTLTGLRNNIDYDIALSVTDNAGNSSPLVASCAVPEQALDFFGNYTNDNGLAGGGFCETEGVGVPAGTSAFGILFSAIAAAMVRRRRRRAR